MRRELLYTVFLLTNLLFIGADFSYGQVEEVQEDKEDSVEVKRNLFQRVKYYFKEAEKDKSAEEFDITFLGGPSYSKDSKFSIGAIVSGAYRLDRKNLDLQPSKVSLFADISTTGFFTAGLTNTTIFPDDAYRIVSGLRFFYNPTRFYGIGFDENDKELYSKYNSLTLDFKTDFLKRIFPNTYVGPTISAKFKKNTNFEDKALEPIDNPSSSAFGAGFVLSYDTRDYISVPHKGIYVKYRQLFYPAFVGNTDYFGEIDFEFSAFKRIWEGGILAYNLDGTFTNGNVPWSMLPTFGGSHQMRGYLFGRYRDKKQINTTLELRQEVVHRVGIAVWGGAGNVFESFDKWDWNHTMPDYGVGLRWEFKHRTNVRVDYGRGRHGQSGFYFNINEAF